MLSRSANLRSSTNSRKELRRKVIKRKRPKFELTDPYQNQDKNKREVHLKSTSAVTSYNAAMDNYSNAQLHRTNYTSSAASQKSRSRGNSNNLLSRPRTAQKDEVQSLVQNYNCTASKQIQDFLLSSKTTTSSQTQGSKQYT